MPETFIVKRNVETAPRDLPVIDIPFDEKRDLRRLAENGEKSRLDSSALSGTSSARERRRQNRLGKIKIQNQENEKSNFIELLQSTMKQQESPKTPEKLKRAEEKPALLAGEQTMTRLDPYFILTF